MKFEDMRLVDCVELDPRTVMLTVLEQWSERRWFRVVQVERVKSYVLSLGVGRWLDGTHYVLRPDPRHFRLMELWASWLAERKLDAFNEAVTPSGMAMVSRRSRATAH